MCGGRKRISLVDAGERDGLLGSSIDFGMIGSRPWGLAVVRVREEGEPEPSSVAGGGDIGEGVRRVEGVHTM